MIPDYQTLMLPLLKLAGDGQEHRINHSVEKIGQTLGISEEERSQILPSGGQTVLYSRVQWARTYLTQAKLLESTRRAHFKITERGMEVLKENPARVDNTLLERYPEFNEFKNRSRVASDEPETTTIAGSVGSTTASLATPDELLRSTISDIEAALGSELLNRILAAPPAFFENLIVSLLLGMGYGGAREEAGRAIGKSGDGGIDGVIDQDPLGLDRVYLQAKRYKADSPVSEPEVRAFSGSLGAHKASKGVFVTTSYFTKPAYDFAEKHPFKMVLIDGAQLTALMLRHNVGVRIADTLHIKKVDEDFFSEE
ncbi:MAG: restriction endonuclease [Alphaproteobacteria bacterium]